MITARYHREVRHRYRLEAARCSGCGHVSIPARLVCPACRGTAFTTVTLGEEGKIVTFTIVRVAADRFVGTTPFAVAIVELNNGVRLTAQVADTDPAALRTGQKVRLVFRKVQEDGRAGILCYGYKAVPA